MFENIARRKSFEARVGAVAAAMLILGSIGAEITPDGPQSPIRGFKSIDRSIPEGLFFSVPPATFDPVMGFRWLPGPIRWVGVEHEEVIIDNTFSGNNYGYISSYDYLPKKQSPETFRIAVLGDSFTAGLELTKPWPERLQQLLRSRTEKRSVEVYAFPIDGGGLLNWHSVFFNQILPQFEFDALIIASWYENLNRKFVTYHSDETAMYINHFDEEDRPKSREAFEEIFREMRSEEFYKFLGKREMEEMVNRVRREGRAAVATVNDYTRKWEEESELAPPSYEFSTQAFIQRYSAERLAMFTEIVDACRKRHIPLIFCAVPTRGGLLRMRKENATLIHRAESEGLCRYFGLHYFDGYAIFDGIDAQAIVDLYWLKYDGHWAQAAADLFALKLAEWITLSNIIPPVGASVPGK